MVDVTTITIIFNLGLLAGLSPCLFPVLPSYVAFLSNTRVSVFKGFLTSLLVLLGIMTMFISLGLITNLVTSQLIGFFGDNFRSFQLLPGVLLLFLGFVLVVKLNVSFTQLSIFSGGSQEKIQKFKNPYLSSYLIGVFFAVIAAPCAIIYFLTLFTIVIGESLSSMAFLMVIFSFGAGIPFFSIGTLLPFIQNMLDQQSPKVKVSQITHYAHKINQTLPLLSGVLIFLVGLFLINESEFIQRLQLF